MYPSQPSARTCGRSICLLVVVTESSPRIPEKPKARMTNCISQLFRRIEAVCWGKSWSTQFPMKSNRWIYNTFWIGLPTKPYKRIVSPGMLSQRVTGIFFLLLRDSFDYPTSFLTRPFITIYTFESHSLHIQTTIPAAKISEIFPSSQTYLSFSAIFRNEKWTVSYSCQRTSDYRS